MPDPDPRAGLRTGDPSDARADGVGRERLRRSLVHPGRGQVVVAVLLAVLGFGFVVQVQDQDRNDAYAGLRESELVEVLDGLTGTAERARSEAERLRETRDALQTESRAREAALGEAQQRARTLNILAGLVPVRGPGLRITITETEGRVSVGSLLDTIQELRTVGAEAMEFNDRYRLGAQSSFDNAVGGIELEGRLLEAPYVLEVIGDPDALKGGLTFSDGPIESLERYDGAEVEVEELESVEIESVRELDRPQHAAPADAQ